MNLERLRLFLEIVDTGSVSAASRRVHLSQPAISRTLKLLEEELGGSLFERTPRLMVPTALGRALEPRARALLAQAEQTRRDLAGVVQRRYFDLRLGTVDSVATWLLPRIVTPLRTRYPELSLKLFTARTAELLRRLEQGELDLAIVAWSGAPAAARPRRVGPYRLGFYGRRDCFATLEDARDEQALAAFPIVELAALPGQSTLIGEGASSFAICNSLASVKALVLGGFGVAALLDFMLDPHEEALLARAGLPHDPDCALYVVGAPQVLDPARLELEEAVAEALAAVVG